MRSPAAPDQLEPLAVLRRGYALAVDADGRSIRDAAQLKAGDRIKLSFPAARRRRP